MGLTDKQERYAQERFLGKSQYDSYLIAYPNSHTYKRKSVDELASKLEKNTKIQSRIAELNKPAEDLLISKKTMILETALKLVDGTATNDEIKKINPQVLNKLLDKIAPTISENKTELSAHRSIADLIKERRKR